MFCSEKGDLSYYVCPSPEPGMYAKNGDRIINSQILVQVDDLTWDEYRQSTKRYLVELEEPFEGLSSCRILSIKGIQEPPT